MAIRCDGGEIALQERRLRREQPFKVIIDPSHIEPGDLMHLRVQLPAPEFDNSNRKGSGIDLCVGEILDEAALRACAGVGRIE